MYALKNKKMYTTFIGKRYEGNPKKFVTNDGYVLTFSNSLDPLFYDQMYVILCRRDENTKLFTLLKCHYWWNKNNQPTNNI